MTDALPLLIEIGTEELPPTSLTALERAFGQLIGEALLSRASSMMGSKPLQRPDASPSSSIALQPLSQTKP